MAYYENCILFLLGKAYQKANSVFKDHFQSFGLTPMQFLVLEAIFENNGESAGNIGKILVLDNATLSGILTRLEESGWISKNLDNVDRRVLRLSVSPRAKELRKKLTAEANSAGQEVLKNFRIEERILLERMLRDFQIQD